MLAAKGYADAVWIVLTGLILIVVLIGAWLVFAWLRRRLNAQPKTDEGNLWTLDGLRQLRNDGLLTEEEYNRLRARLLEAFRDRSGKPAGLEAPTETVPENPAAADEPESDEPGEGSDDKNDPGNGKAV